MDHTLHLLSCIVYRTYLFTNMDRRRAKMSKREDDILELMINTLAISTQAMPKDIRDRAKTLGVNYSLINAVIDISPYMGRLWYVTSDIANGKTLASWLTNFSHKLTNEHYLKPTILDELYNQVYLRHIPGNKVGEVFEQLDGISTIGHIAFDLGFYDISTDKIVDIIQDAIQANPQAIEDYKGGNQRALSGVMGYIVKHYKGVDMKLAGEELRKTIAASN